MRWGIRCGLAAALLGVFGANAAVLAAEPPHVVAAAALRAAASAARRGDAADAARRYDDAASIAEIAAPARLLAARAWLDANRPDAAEVSVRHALARDVGPPWHADLLDVLGRTRAARGDRDGAQRAWQEALDRGVEPSRAAELRLELAAAHEAAGDLDAAARTLRAAWIENAGRAHADRAEERLAALERALGQPLRRAADWLARADALAAAQRSKAALRAYEAVLARNPDAAQRAHALRGRADALFRLRRYDAAARAFAALGADPEARLWRARAMARAGQVEEAIEVFENWPADTPPTIRAWAHLLAATLHEAHGRTERAAALLASAARDGDDEVAGDALWRLGFGAYRAGDLATARKHLAPLAERAGDPVERATARYWAARALGRDSDAARRELAALARELPFTYYGARAREHVGSLAPQDAPGPIAERAVVQLAEPDLVTARALAAAGLEALALRATASLAERARTFADRVVVARLYAESGDPHRAQLLLVRNDGLRLAQGPRGAGDEAWRIAWPNSYADESRAAAPAGARLPAWLVPALIREESGYRTDAVSSAGALGLMQLMPDTARRLAARANLAGFDPRRLVEPALNVRLGTLYLDELAARFGGRTEAIAAAYNAGPGAVENWRRGGVADEVEWVEAIPYEETRGYVKRIVRSMYVYRTLYP